MVAQVAKVVVAQAVETVVVDLVGTEEKAAAAGLAVAMVVVKDKWSYRMQCSQACLLGLHSNKIAVNQGRNTLGRGAPMTTMAGNQAFARSSACRSRQVARDGLGVRVLRARHLTDQLSELTRT